MEFFVDAASVYDYVYLPTGIMKKVRIQEIAGLARAVEIWDEHNAEKVTPGFMAGISTMFRTSLRGLLTLCVERKGHFLFVDTDIKQKPFRCACPRLQLTKENVMPIGWSSNRLYSSEPMDDY